VGNFIDRIRFGHVIDFIVWKLGDDLRWPTFNVADAFITLGVTLMLVEIIRDAWSEPESQSPSR
jgi:signal peptidase II